MKAISLFSGIGGIDLAFSWAGFDIVAQVEIDDFCRKVRSKHAPEYWPNAKQYEDINHVGKHNLPETDVLFGGFPCQDLSHAGKRAGLDAGTRSGLWWEFARLISELRPRVVLLENVAGIYTLGGADVIGSLAEMGYDALWFPVRAADVGAPHSRERWFCVVYSTSDRQQRRGGDLGERHLFPKSIREHQKSKQAGHRGKRRISKGGQTMAYTQRRRYQKSAGTGKRTRYSKWHGTTNQQSGRTELYASQPEREILVNTSRAGRKKRHAPGQSDWPGHHTGRSLKGRGNRAAQSRMGRRVDGLPPRVDRHHGRWPARPGEQQHDYEPPRTITGGVNRNARIKALGNAVVPQVVYPIALAIKQFLEDVA